MSTAVAAILAALIAAAITLLLSWQIRSYQLRESESRADASLNIDVATRLLKISEADHILEIRVEVKNNSRKAWCIPAVYVYARALAGGQMPGSYTGESDFSELEDCGKLSKVCNVARMEHSVLQLAPDEVESFVRWDTLDAAFIRQYRVIVVNVEAFSASADLIGEKRHKYKQGKYRLDWIRFMNEGGGVRNRYVVFARWPVTEPARQSPLEPGRRYLRRECGEADEDNSKKFAEVLSTVVKWNRHTTVNLNPEPGVAHHHSPPDKASELTTS